MVRYIKSVLEQAHCLPVDLTKVRAALQLPEAQHRLTDPKHLALITRLTGAVFDVRDEGRLVGHHLGSLEAEAYQLDLAAYSFSCRQYGDCRGRKTTFARRLEVTAHYSLTDAWAPEHVIAIADFACLRN